MYSFHQSHKRHFSITLCLFLIISLSGCVSLDGPIFSPAAEPKDDQALLYLYREKSGYGSARNYYIFVNGKLVTTMRSGGYYPVFIDSGDVIIHTDLQFNMLLKLESLIPDGREALSFTAESGKTYYARYKLNMGAWRNNVTFDLVEDSVGKEEISECQLLPDPSPPTDEQSEQ